jgi:2-haloacid dehalogenase
LLCEKGRDIGKGGGAADQDLKISDMKSFDTLVFDLGGVLVDWNPDYLYATLIPDEEERRWFLSTICTPDWNEEQDGGRSLKDGTDLLVKKYPEHESSIRAFYDRWEEMLGGPIHATVEIFRELKEKTDLKLYALTNWSAETFPIALEQYEFLHWFDGRLVSGEEKIRKPMPEIYQRLIGRFGIDPKKAIYVDDNLRNVVPAREEGFYGIYFRSPEQFRAELVELGVL